MLTHPVVWQDLGIELTDTGGMFGASQDPLQQLVFERGPARAPRGRPDCVRRRWPGRASSPATRTSPRRRERATCRCILAVNKTDDRRARSGALELYRLGFDPILEVSAEHGLGVGELLDEIVKRLPQGRAATQPRC